MASNFVEMAISALHSRYLNKTEATLATIWGIQESERWTPFLFQQLTRFTERYKWIF